MSSENSTVVYKPVPGFPGYRVGDDGTVWSRKRRVGLGTGGGIRVELDAPWKKMTLTKNNHGRLIVYLSPPKTFFQVSRLVLIAFVGPPPENTECCHDDGDCTNNNLTNLRWDTRKANHRDAVRHGRKGHCRSPNAKLTVQNVLDIRSSKENTRSLSSKYGVCLSTIKKARSGKQGNWTQVIGFGS